MENSIPSDFVTPFTNERLSTISNALLEQCYDTDDDLQSPYDSNYSIGCTRFDRQKNRLIDLPLEHDWINVVDPSNRLVMSIGGAPFRFTNDNYILPRKKSSALISKSEYNQMTEFSNISGQLEMKMELVDSVPNNEKLDLPEKWRFYIDVIESSELDTKEYEIYFVGLNVIDQPCCIWKYTDHITSNISSVDENIPKKIETNRAKITLPNSKDRKQNNE